MRTGHRPCRCIRLGRDSRECRGPMTRYRAGAADAFDLHMRRIERGCDRPADPNRRTRHKMRRTRAAFVRIVHRTATPGAASGSPSRSASPVSFLAPVVSRRHRARINVNWSKEMVRHLLILVASGGASACVHRIRTDPFDSPVVYPRGDGRARGKARVQGRQRLASKRNEGVVLCPVHRQHRAVFRRAVPKVPLRTRHPYTPPPSS